ncbi:hypothetical protein HB662_01420 [Roseomonas frigidaquae]|uniref:Uncharacterized protein n=1 Tax=Falsiroseomonas frigidaquae TaxID=487318 RepID=A0ABX1EU27_9PROT|nr:hypothetical protein [Falsiroseomonas frigidaquae]NKE43419.1 hypothetical protein [Falsiroseomonas frigidaquae]
MIPEVEAALDAAAEALMTPADWHHAAALHGGEAGPGHRAQARKVVAAFLLALPDRFPMPRPGGVTWGHASGEMKRLASFVEATADG